MAVVTLEQIEAELRARFPSCVPDDKVVPIFQSPERGAVGRSSLAKVDLNFFPVEKLLEEASILLNRCLQERDAKLEIEVKLAEFWLEFLLLEEQEIVRREQIAAGEFSLPRHTAELEEEMQKASVIYSTETYAKKSEAEQVREITSAVRSTYITLAGKMQQLSGYDHLADLKRVASDLAEIQINWELISAKAEKAASEGDVSARTFLEKLATLRKNFEQVNSASKLELFEIEVKWRHLKASLATMPGFGLNFRQRLIEITRMFDADYVAALNRLRAAEKGLRSVYGIDRPLPDLNAGESLTDAVLWARECIEDLACLLDREVTYTKVVSVRSSVSHQDWQAFLTGGEVEFEISIKHDPDIACVRVRGIRACILSAKSGFWQVALAVPGTAETTLPDDSVAQIDQRNVPLLLLQNVGIRTPGRLEAEVQSRGFMNVSPFGRWRMTMPEYSSVGSARADMEDIQFDLSLAAIAK
ncbi:hypothetical protein [Mesorhizobium sp.]|uniref:hypothetical protein n=1 Tax=Mesorhizobium sp. TaxID=1871066 RepID=UPI000FE514D4|nr:hypothetical protein [Mesorhizobium sp.]RWP51356.1 MAG: hypothetical protein EOR06_22410 [Mesorhizobium sp.]